MGSIYRTTYINAAGERVPSATIWLKYRAGGRIVRQSSGTEKEKEAKKLLALREGAAAQGKVILPRADKVTVRELADDLKAEYAANGRRSADRLEFSLAHLLPALGDRRAVALTTAEVTAYVVARQKAGAANATVNRELAALKRAFTLALRAEKLTRRPHIPMLREDNVRQGFFEPAQLQAVLVALPEEIRPVIRFAAITGWRKQEVLSLTWAQVDFRAGLVRLEAGTTKNGEGREFPLTPELRSLLEAQRAHTDRLQRELGAVVRYVFHRGGEPIRCFREAWAVACRRAGVPGRLVHDLRRTAVRAMVQAGIPERVAMKLSGHKTASVFARYAIVSPGDLTLAAEKLAQAR
jgi:integrase